MAFFLRALLCIELVLHVVPAVAGQDLDTGFLREEPYRKQKQNVDLSSIRTERDMAVVKQAMTPVMRFIVGLVFTKPNPAVDRDVMTEHGRLVLKRPPIRSQYNRYIAYRVGDWKVCSETMLSFHAEFGDLFHKNLWEEDFLFVNEGNGWRFDDHRRCDPGLAGQS